ncbi:MAG TPA: 5,10-methylene tetrahydromethanopterin reductase [Gammaproteobacteria bacterium]|jgi:alkanesulfonate monooxygenase|nr:5,10-methylene tetrahydromethanopterin reductase [Gammaproteobacteria bacterium]
MPREILLNAFNMNCVAHQSSGLWRHPRDQSREYTSLKHWQDLAQTLERGLFDGLFLADVSGVYDVYDGSPEAAIRAGMQIPTNDPFSIVPVMAASTEHLAFGITGSIPYEPPYAFARRMSTLDHLTVGRVAWNVVTGYLDSAAKGVGKLQQTEHDTRYDIAADYMELVYKLWEGSWEDDAVIYDRISGVFAEPDKVHEIVHEGEYFNLRAIHLCEPSVQRTPVIFQAGGSVKGQAFAARHAECVFIGAGNIAAAKETVKSLREQAVAAGRQKDDLKIFALTCIVVDETDLNAKKKLEEYTSYGLSEGSLALMSGWTGIDLSKFGLDERAENLSSQALQSALKSLGSRTVRDWADFLAVGGGATIISGSPITVVDQMAQWLEEADIDGFNVAYTVLPECFENIVEMVVPEMQARGLYKTEYAEGSMRQKLFGRGDRLNADHPAAAFRRR